ncbi:MAG: peptide chain release factor N(5)-glutamine methyltransferase [Thermoanaerobaculia bacterium]|nr:peptide chain release factor N(5)-glutamine methyltransferase [Thermoanaerobaculia bacterium]
MATVRALLDDARVRLAENFQPRREAALLLGRLLGRSEAWLLAHDDHTVPAEVATHFEQWLTRRLAGEPVAYLFGEREFFGRPFRVDPRVLIPRPETEHLIETVLALDVPADARVLDIGVGSGAIAATLSLERPGWRVFGSDLSLAALVVAQTNGRLLGASVELAAGDLTAPWCLAMFDLVVSNPPYVQAGDRTPELRFEPALALVADDHPAGPAVAVYARLLAELGGAGGLRAGTPVVLEIGWNQQPALERLAEETGFDAVSTVIDYAGHPRTMVFLRR